jgi:endogenous inhibitor of DNA gyrase (YacG/DUF329 family)
MYLKRIYQDVEGVTCPLCGSAVLKDAKNPKNVKYFCSGEKNHDLTKNKVIKDFLADKK